ncbi:hypothetical protein BD309DRAFT_944451 [Dichomitus squalens]|nr:hypothetical protein BD309DRAFT_944451 [Dichomitus squalens]
MTELLSNIVGAALSYFTLSPSSKPPVESSQTQQNLSLSPFPNPVHSSQAHQNLRRYAKSAVLPEMILGRAAPPLPPDKTKSVKNPVFEQHEIYRHLEVINPFKDLKDLAHAYAEANIPSKPIGNSDSDIKRNARISIPVEGYDIPQLTTGVVTTLPDVVEWVRQFPLTTIRRMMHMVYPETLDYKMEHLGTPMERDKGIMECFKWGPDENVIMEAADLYRPTVMFFVQPPWMLAPRDMEIFVKTQKFPNPWAKDRYQMRSYERVWSKIHDGCAQNHARFFVLTTYRDWVFGAFSKEQTEAWVSDVMTWDSENPNLLECLFYWLSSATVRRAKLVNPFIIPEIYEPIQMEVDPEDMEHYDPNASLAGAPSVDEQWEALSNARTHDPSIQLSDDSLSDETILDVHDSPTRRVRLGFGPEMIRDWCTSGTLGAPPPTYSTVSEISGYTASSASTIRDFASAPEPRLAGTILVGGPGRLREAQPRGVRA